MKREKIRKLIFPFILCAVVLSLVSCGPKARVAVSQLDTPGHHTFTGLKLLDQEKYTDAKIKFFARRDLAGLKRTKLLLQ